MKVTRLFSAPSISLSSRSAEINRSVSITGNTTITPKVEQGLDDEGDFNGAGLA